MAEALPPTARTQRIRRSWVIAVLLVAALTGAIVVGVAMLRGDREDVSYPDEWASLVRPYVAIVEDERELDSCIRSTSSL